MANYEVTLYYHTGATVTVSASDEESTIEKAYNKINNKDLLANLQ